MYKACILDLLDYLRLTFCFPGLEVEKKSCSTQLSGDPELWCGCVLGCCCEGRCPLSEAQLTTAVIKVFLSTVMEVEPFWRHLMPIFFNKNHQLDILWKTVIFLFEDERSHIFALFFCHKTSPKKCRSKRLLLERQGDTFAEYLAVLPATELKRAILLGSEFNKLGDQDEIQMQPNPRVLGPIDTLKCEVRRYKNDISSATQVLWQAWRKITSEFQKLEKDRLEKGWTQ